MTNRARGRAPDGFAAGLALPLEGWRLLRRERALWPLAVAPVGIAALALGAVTAAGIVWFPEAYALATGWVPELQAERWYAWLWVGPARLVLWLVARALLVAMAVVALVVGFALANLASSPFLDALAERVEQGFHGEASGPPPGWRQVLRDGGRALVEEARRLGFFAAVWLGITVGGFLVPGGQLLAAPLLTVFTVLFLPLDYASYTLDRAGVSFRRKRAWIAEHVGTVGGFGVASFALCALPLANLLAMPILVVAGTLLALRLPPRVEGAGDVPGR